MKDKIWKPDSIWDLIEALNDMRGYGQEGMLIWDPAFGEFNPLRAVEEILGCKSFLFHTPPTLRRKKSQHLL